MRANNRTAEQRVGERLELQGDVVRASLNDKAN